MNTSPPLEIKVKGMSCQHCVKAVTAALHARSPEALVTVDLAAGTVTIQHSQLSSADAAKTIADEGYEVVA